MPSELEALQFKNRNFICSCQKAYLSYAALFTHIKQKHGGKAPGQIVRPRSLNKRGRPRKNDKPASEKGARSESSDGILGNNNLKNINFVNESNFNQNQSPLNNTLAKGFTSYKNDKYLTNNPSTQKRSEQTFTHSKHHKEQLPQDLEYQYDENMEFADPNNQLSSNTLALASIIIGLQQLFKEVNSLDMVKDAQLEAFSTYISLKQFHSQKLLENKDQKRQQEVFMLGNIICAFLNFCHQTLDEKVAYQQIVLLMVCLLQHIKERKGGNILISCRKEVIHECLPSFFQQYLERVIIKSKFNFWIFKQNNSFKVLIWFLNWLSAIEANYIKNNLNQPKIPESMEHEEQDLDEEQDLQEDQAVEFEHPTFLKQVLKNEKNVFQRNTTFSSIEKRSVQNGSLNKGEGQIQKSVESSEEQKEIEGQIGEQQQNQSDSQFNSNEPENDKNQFVGLERLSSQVR